MGLRSSIAYAPAAIGNVAVGFDVLGHAFPALGDRVRASRVRETGVRIVSVTGTTEDLPFDPSLNTAGRAVLSLLDSVRPPWGVELSLEKGIPLGAGLGGSAASAVAAVVAVNALLDEALPELELLRHAVEGEVAAAGARVADNVAPSLFGGLVLTLSLDPPRVQRIPIPERIRCVVVRPHRFLATRASRDLLQSVVDLSAMVRQTANMAGFIAGCHTGDLQLIRASLRDAVIEPQRALTIPGFVETQRAALDQGALGCSISGAGPSLFAWCEDAIAEAVAHAMHGAMQRAGGPCDHWQAPIGGAGARVVERE